MGLHIDTFDLTHTAEARALLDSLDDSTFVRLGVLFGVELCALGGSEHPASWHRLRHAWRQLDPEDRELLTEACTRSMRDRGLIAEQAAGRGVQALILQACYKLGPRLRLLLSARQSPAFLIAAHHESRTPAVTYFLPRGTNAIVQEIPGRTDDNGPEQPTSPLDVLFSYRLSTQAFAASELARWAFKPVADARCQPKPPRLISFSGRTASDRPTSYQLTVHRNGKKAHLDGPDISADFTPRQLTTFLTDTITTWADTRCWQIPAPRTSPGLARQQR